MVCLQYFALGVGAMPEGARGAKDAASVRPHLDVYVALGPSSSSSSGATQKADAPKKRAKDKGAAGEVDGEVDEEVLRLAEALLHEGLEDLAKRAVAVRIRGWGGLGAVGVMGGGGGKTVLSYCATLCCTFIEHSRRLRVEEAMMPLDQQTGRSNGSCPAIDHTAPILLGFARLPSLHHSAFITATLPCLTIWLLVALPCPP
jgi:hypothetical protein